MTPLWLATLIVLGATIGFVALIFLVCFGFVGWLKLKDKIGGKKK